MIIFLLCLTKKILSDAIEISRIYIGIISKNIIRFKKSGQRPTSDS